MFPSSWSFLPPGHPIDTIIANLGTRTAIAILPSPDSVAHNTHSQVQVVTTDDDGVGHFGRVDDTGQNAATDRDVTGEGALLVDVCAVDGLCQV